MMMQLEAIQINGIRPPSLQSAWAFDGKDLSLEVEHMAQLCRTPSPDVIKRQLQRERRPHSTPGIPLGVQRRGSRPPSRCLQFRKVHKQQKSKFETDFDKRLNKFKPPKATQVELGPGYVLTTTKDRVIAHINTDEMFDSGNYKADKDKTRHSVDESNRLIDQLQQQVGDLTVYLEEEKLNHKFDVKRTSEDYQKEIERLKEDHTNHIRAIEEDNAEQLQQVEDHNKNMIEVMKNAYSEESDQTKQELSLIRAAFASYKDTIGEELDTRWRQKELEVKLDFERKAEKLFAGQKNALTLKKNRELDDLVKEHKRQISTIVDDNRNELDVLLRKFTASVADAERVKQMINDVEVARKESKRLHKELAVTKEKLRKALNELDDTKIKLLGYQENFAEKVSEVDDKYAMKVDNLRADLADLRKRYMGKCDELYTVKSGIDLQQENGLAKAKAVMQTLILSRARADVSLVAFRDDGLESGEMIAQNKAATQRKLSSNKPKRPLSAPSTPNETSVAVWQSRGNTSSAVPPSRPDSSQPWQSSGDNTSLRMSQISKRQSNGISGLRLPHNKLTTFKSATQTSDNKLTTSKSATQTSDKKLRTIKSATQTSDNKLRTAKSATQTSDNRLRSIKSATQTPRTSLSPPTVHLQNGESLKLLPNR